MSQLQPDEALHAFMDGELSASEEQSLFNELASNGELRTEMKDLIAIRNAVQRDMIFPYAANEASVLAAAGLTSGLGASTLAAGTGVAAAHASWVNSVFLGLCGVLGGLFLAVNSYSGGYINNASNLPPSLPPSTEVGQPVAGYTQPLVQHDTVFAVKIVRVPQTNAVSKTPIVSAETQEPTVADYSEHEESTVVINPVTALNARENYSHSSDGGFTQQDKLSYISQPADKLPVTVRFRSLASGISSASATPMSVQNALLPNSAYGLFLPLNSEHRIGLEMGTESFKQVFEGVVDGRTGQYTQTPVLFWMGATYNYTPAGNWFIPGLSPFAEATAGIAFAQGPVGRATVGLSYQPIGLLKISAGIDASTLMYGYQNQRFFSSKIGMSYGISIDLGALK